jgi:hypothetical protein
MVHERFPVYCSRITKSSAANAARITTRQDEHITFVFEVTLKKL